MPETDIRAPSASRCEGPDPKTRLAYAFVYWTAPLGRLLRHRQPLTLNGYRKALSWSWEGRGDWERAIRTYEEETDHLPRPTREALENLVLSRVGDRFGKAVLRPELREDLEDMHGLFKQWVDEMYEAFEEILERLD